MMEMLNKFASFIVVGIICYLAYSSVSIAVSKPSGESKELPAVTKKMLNPVFIEPQDNASPSGRDPFEVGGGGLAGISDSTAAEGGFTGSGAVDGNNVRFPDKLMGMLSGDDGQQLALIGGEVYGVGSLVKPSDSNALWQVSSIENETVILTYNGLRAVLKIQDVEADYNDILKKISETEGQKEQK